MYEIWVCCCVYLQSLFDVWRYRGAPAKNCRRCTAVSDYSPHETIPQDPRAAAACQARTPPQRAEQVSGIAATHEKAL